MSDNSNLAGRNKVELCGMANNIVHYHVYELMNEQQGHTNHPP